MAISSDRSFYGFVSAYYRNDPYVMLEKFADAISEKAADVSIDWNGSSDNVALDGVKVSGDKVKGLTNNDNGRCWIVAWSKVESVEHSGKTVSVNYPLIRFQNFRKHFDKPVFFSGLSQLWEEYKKYQSGQRPLSGKIDRANLESKLEKVAQDKLVTQQEKAEAVQKDFVWWGYLRRQETSLYFDEEKGIDGISKFADLRTGVTTTFGSFDALPITDVDAIFRGMQRYYFNVETRKCVKRFRKGLDPSGAFIQFGKLVDGQPIYVYEGAANAGLGFSLTGIASLAALFADNIVLVVTALRAKYKNSKIIIVSDNDQKGVNKGVAVSVEACNKVENAVYIVPQFESKDLSDLVDYSACYGKDNAKVFLLSAL